MNSTNSASEDKSSKEEITKKILFQTISKFGEIGEDKIAFKSRFIEDLFYDSLATAETIMELEDKLDIEIEDNTVENMNTVEEVYNYLLTCKPYEGFTPKDIDVPKKYSFMGDLSHENFDGSECAVIDCCNDITISIDRYNYNKNDTVFPEVLNAFKNKTVKITVEVI